MDIVPVTHLFSRVLFSLFVPFAGHPCSSPFLGIFSHFSPPRNVLCSVEQSAQRRAWRGADPGWTSPQSPGRKFLPEICVKKGQDIVPVGAAFGLIETPRYCSGLFSTVSRPQGQEPVCVGGGEAGQTSPYKMHALR